MRTFKLVLAIIILVLLLIFGANNPGTVQVRFLGLQTGELPLFLLIIFCFALGFLAASLLGTIRISQLRRQVHQLEKQRAALGRSAGKEPGPGSSSGQ